MQGVISMHLRLAKDKKRDGFISKIGRAVFARDFRATLLTAKLCMASVPFFTRSTGESKPTTIHDRIKGLRAYNRLKAKKHQVEKDAFLMSRQVGEQARETRRRGEAYADMRAARMGL